MTSRGGSKGKKTRQSKERVLENAKLRAAGFVFDEREQAWKAPGAGLMSRENALLMVACQHLPKVTLVDGWACTDCGATGGR